MTDGFMSQKTRDAARWVGETLWLTALAFAFAMGFRATIACAYEVPTGSMEPTIMSHDRIVSEKVSLWFAEPEAGDVVVIANPIGGAIPFVKRVIALPGQTVDVQDGRVLVDGEPLDEPYTHGLQTRPVIVELPTTVPEGQLWVMGDNRPGSKDSRDFGPVPVDSVLGRVIAVYWPPHHARGLLGQ